VSAVCKTCEAPVVYTPPAPGDHAGRGTFTHSDGSTEHKVEPRPLCPACKSLGYAFYQTNWGHGHRCPDCGRDDYYSLGD
jgi:hypothetical protein